MITVTVVSTFVDTSVFRWRGGTIINGHLSECSMCLDVIS